MSLNKASIQFLIPKTTLKRKLEKYKSTQITVKATKKLGRFEQDFTKAQETVLATYVKQIESLFIWINHEKSTSWLVI
ncbi:unnamed protein product [Parnassius apollo]|uniref:(apollo) hypothetical protein n=1 Tax=Parnassius apollo TaxID=110799 RepID=A0A8S3Y6L9_PARAO|nr:unnamed protein product [Parnassius apollo]